ncbi:hypothetical protein [Glycomyces buryatensis]|uniref:Uncharacterized protein n=1 Tax=Glycomyces buryatensis TaxID=2570927 RepID=A0A4S8QFM2_9ACTN|nr:hypothetical protein [Glycomyces buryatensis]THV42471.1 hypothetical protein FAB82_06245 [Glycomyces buryatensis]
MRELVFWKEIGLSTVKEAQERYAAIVLFREPVTVAEADPWLREFINDLPSLGLDLYLNLVPDLVPVDEVRPETRISAHGVIVQFGPDVPQKTTARIYELAETATLSMFNPQSPMVLGSDDEEWIEFH